MRTIVLGLGNSSWGDDSAGPRVARAISDRLVPREATVEEASIAGLDILDLLADYEKAIIIDAIRSNQGQPGTVYRLGLSDLAAKRVADPHEVDFVAALELGRELGLSLPDSVTIFGIEIGQAPSLQEECTPAVRAAIPICADMIVSELRSGPERLLPSSIVSLATGS